ncbi:hypothetical protein ACP26L_36050 (plasmid) [Paenibacillus sp. S-38]|uniref:hypothetical protein n=1 Tax=Paenibacillus sp. S-38 TaxID=3416710 RepID=UPI003CFAC789
MKVIQTWSFFGFIFFFCLMVINGGGIGFLFTFLTFSAIALFMIHRYQRREISKKFDRLLMNCKYLEQKQFRFDSIYDFASYKITKVTVDTDESITIYYKKAVLGVLEDSLTLTRKNLSRYELDRIAFLDNYNNRKVLLIA